MFVGLFILFGMENLWWEIRRNFNWVLMIRILIIYILGYDNFEVEYYGLLVGVYCEELGYVIIRVKLVV